VGSGQQLSCIGDTDSAYSVFFVQNSVDAKEATGAKGVYRKTADVCTTMGPSIRLNVSQLCEYKFTWQQLMGPPHVGNLHIQVLDTRFNIKCSSANFLCLWGVAHQSVAFQNWRLNIPDCDLIWGHWTGWAYVKHMHVDTKPNNMFEQKINQLTPSYFSLIELACSLHITFIGTNLPTSKKQYAVLQS